MHTAKCTNHNWIAEWIFTKCTVPCNHHNDQAIEHGQHPRSPPEPFQITTPQKEPFFIIINWFCLFLTLYQLKNVGRTFLCLISFTQQYIEFLHGLIFIFLFTWLPSFHKCLLGICYKPGSMHGTGHTMTMNQTRFLLF